jgi:poly-beta-hydroxyalkanoate depolymerase
MSYTKEESFRLYCYTRLVATDDKKLNKTRNEIYDNYDKWFYLDENYFLDIREERFQKLLNHEIITKSFNKKCYRTTRIGQPEFYKLLIDRYGIAPLKRKSDKQLKYRLTFN